jgi:hypothetical protein
MEKEEIEFWLAVNDEGDRTVSFDGAKEAMAALVDEFGGAAVRTVKMSVLMALPTAAEADPLEVSDDDFGADQTTETAIEEVEEVAAA